MLEPAEGAVGLEQAILNGVFGLVASESARERVETGQLALGELPERISAYVRIWSEDVARHDVIASAAGCNNRTVPRRLDKWKSFDQEEHMSTITTPLARAESPALRTGSGLMALASLGFIGMGAKPPAPEWGAMISVARTYMHNWWWYAVFPGCAIYLTVLGFNLFGDGLRDVLDPRSSRG